MSFVIKDNYVLDKYNQIWNKVKKTLGIKFHSTPVYDEKYIKAKVREFSGVIKTNFLVRKFFRTNITLALPVWLLILLWEWKKRIIPRII